MKKLLVLAALGIIALGAFELATAPPAAAATNCYLVKCLPCPDGYVPSPTPGNCCRCVRAH